MKRAIVIGSRESRLAVIQAQLVMAQLHAAHPELELTLRTMKTEGDRRLDVSIEAIGGKGLFVRELDAALLRGDIDLAVHSLKDMPDETHPDLPLLACSRREDARDALVLPAVYPADATPAAPIGSSSARRRMQLAGLYPGVDIRPVRGNVPTRIAKLDAGEYGGLVLALAGLKRLGLGARASRVFSVDELVPAAGQGILAIQGRRGEDYGFLDAVNDPGSALAASAERGFIRALGCGCTSPAGVYAEPVGDGIRIVGAYAFPDERTVVKGRIEGSAAQARTLAEMLAEQLRARLG